MQRLVNFMIRSARLQGGEFVKKEQVKWQLAFPQDKSVLFTTDRDLAIKEDHLDLVGLEHPIIRELMAEYRTLDNTSRAVAGRIEAIPSSGILYIWIIQTQTKDAQLSKHIIPIAITEGGGRAPWLEKLGEKLLSLHELPPEEVLKWKDLAVKNKQIISEILHRDLQYAGVVEENMSYSTKLLAVFGLQA